MRRFFNSLVLLAVLSLLSATRASAITFTNLYMFTADQFGPGPNAQETNSDGVGPSGFVISGDTIYGTAFGGGIYGYGTIFRLDKDGTHFTNLFNFNLGAFDPATSTYTNTTGDYVNPGLLLISNTLYGTTFEGGKFDAGTVFKIDTDGSNFSTIYSLDFTNGQGPSSGLTLYSNTLYGTAAGGGTNGNGTVFVVNLSNLSFGKICDFTNQEEPYGGVVVTSNGIFGFGRYGGTSSNGVVYRTGGGGYVDIFNFDGSTGSGSYATPVLSGNTLFGMTYSGGTNGGGNIFRINTDGLQYTNLYSLQAQSGANTTGSNPYDLGGLVLSNGILYGATSVSGINGQGTVFQLNTDGTGFTVLHSFGYSDGSQPDPLQLVGGTLYGASTYGIQGISLGDGAIFALILQPELNIYLTNNQAVLTWADPSYSLYSGPTITNIVTKVAGAVSPYSNAVTGTASFFQLRAN